MSVTVYGKLKTLQVNNLSDDFSVILINKKCVKNAFHRRESPKVSDSANSVII